MSEKNFLGRWSRRKSEARADAQPEVADRSGEGRQTSMPAATDGGDTEPQIDLSVLPPIDSITAATDITAFLRKGIPQELTRAALRRAWTADPAIRDFVGLAENAWDFNDPNAMPGFGPLECSEAELGALVDRVVGRGRKVGEDLLQALTNPLDPDKDSLPSRSSEKNFPEEVADPQAVREEHSEPPSDHAAPQPQLANQAVLLPRRTHGGALPQ